MRLHRENMEEEKKKNEDQPLNQSPEATPPAENDLETKLTGAEKQIEVYKDLLYRKAAEFENYKKRSENEANAFVKYASESLIGDLIPVLDDFERFMKSAKSSTDADSLYRGIELVYQKLLKNLQKRGLKSFETVGKEFDVNFHDALLQIPREDVAPHTVLEEIEKGYTLHEKVIRHAKVIVSTVPSDGTAASGENPSMTNNESETGKS